MSNKFFEGAYLQPGAIPDFGRLFGAVRALKPKCTDCGIPLQESVTGIRSRQNGDKVEKLCRACAVSAIGERLLEDLPR